MSDRRTDCAAVNSLATDFLALSQSLRALIAQTETLDYAQCVEALVDQMRRGFPALTEDHNPVRANLAGWDRGSLKFIIQEYAAFSNAAIHMFLEARIRNHWAALTDEIIHNMDEEFGDLTRGVPHLELMRYGYLEELGIETEDVGISAGTRDFIDRMMRLFRDPDNAFLAGALLAFETTAVDEFRVVDKMLRQYRALGGGEIAASSLTGQYIAGHVASGVEVGGIDPEMEHYQGMVRAIGAGMEGQDRSILARGFLAVCLELNHWWEFLAQQAPQQGLRRTVLGDRTRPPSPYSALLARLDSPPPQQARAYVHAPVA